MPNQKKITRQKRVIVYLQNQLKTGIRWIEGPPVEDDQRKRIEFELGRLLNPKAKIAKKESSDSPQDHTNKWYIDIYAVKYGYIKNSERRKNKGKSRKGMKKAKTVSFLKSVVAQPGMLIAYKEGRMGLSPKTHIFKTRTEGSYQL